MRVAQRSKNDAKVPDGIYLAAWNLGYPTFLTQRKPLQLLAAGVGFLVDNYSLSSNVCLMNKEFQCDC
jgi:hypothetical protein